MSKTLEEMVAECLEEVYPCLVATMRRALDAGWRGDWLAELLELVIVQESLAVPIDDRARWQSLLLNACLTWLELHEPDYGARMREERGITWP